MALLTKSILGSSSPIIQAPTITPPKVMPVPDDTAVKDAQKRSLIRQRRRSGRQSTILTDTSGSETLG